jgi:hypothetical protein
MEKFTDYTLNRDRVYNPETDQVYTVDRPSTSTTIYTASSTGSRACTS